MRRVYTLLLLFIAIALFAQDDTGPVKEVQSSATSKWQPLLETSHWRETSAGQRNGYVLTLEQYEIFTEDAGANPNRKYQYLRGRWVLDTTVQTLTLAVDGLMGAHLVHRRYLRVRDYYLDYEVVQLSGDSLELRDQQTGDHRTFLRTQAKPFKDPLLDEKVKLELPGKGGFKLPGGLRD